MHKLIHKLRKAQLQDTAAVHSVIDEEIETDIDLSSCLNDPSRESLAIKSKKELT